MLALKIEDKHAADNMSETFRVPGIAFAEDGASDAGLSYVGLQPPGSGQAPEVTAHRARVLAATKAARIFFMDGGVNTSNIQEKAQRRRDYLQGYETGNRRCGAQADQAANAMVAAATSVSALIGDRS